VDKPAAWAGTRDKVSNKTGGNAVAITRPGEAQALDTHQLVHEGAGHAGRDDHCSEIGEGVGQTQKNHANKTKKQKVKHCPREALLLSVGVAHHPRGTGTQAHINPCSSTVQRSREGTRAMGVRGLTPRPCVP
jgi:hypothetical protein